jgi:hypothetical protein
MLAVSVKFCSCRNEFIKEQNSLVLQVSKKFSKLMADMLCEK